MAGRTLDLERIVSPDQLASQIANQFTEWSSRRAKWLDEAKELRQFVFQTSTKDTSVGNLPWKNSTTTPKLCQIRDNLHANYMAALFPNENWINWQGGDEESSSKNKKTVIEAYVKNKAEESNFRATMSRLVYDWIDYGMPIATVEYVNEVHVGEDGEEIPQYVGPRLVRISPYDIVFNPAAAEWNDTPKIVRSIKSIGELHKDVQDRPELGYEADILAKIVNIRKQLGQASQSDINKNDGYLVDGFGSYLEYIKSGYVEILEFYGDLYDIDSGTLYENHVITVVDRTHVIRKQPIPAWNKNKFRTTQWRPRPDSLYGMGPLNNLVGMQYRIDHLENAKADAFDLIIQPITKIKGFVEDFNYGPGARIYLGDDGDVGFMPPDVTALNANTEIAILEQKMEEFAGAPKQAMGIRTPGEKTAFEVQTLENASGRIFQSKISFFEQEFEESLLNDFLEVGRRNLNGSDSIRILDDEIDVALFKTVTKEDITASGKLRPIGARHFATKANMVQNLNALSNSALGQDPAVNVHISGKKMARAIEDLLGLEKFGLVSDNIRVTEQAETQQMVQAAQQATGQPPEGVVVDETSANAVDIPPEGL